MIKEHKRKASIAAYICLAILALAFVSGLLGFGAKGGVGELIFSLLGIVMGVVFLCSAWFYIKAKGRSGWWILALLLSVVGIIILALLKDHAPENYPPGAVP